ncbi:hypothetical protein QLX67_06540 [Balneolaceae bacterium ANBcel3]|nr:hypothetical protein [Balneolaceae bacterium ANBcel3]
MTYHEQPYYREYLSLLKELRSVIQKQNEKLKQLKEENTGLGSHIEQLQTELEEIKNQPVPYSEESPSSGNHAPGLFDPLPEEDRVNLKKQISDIIGRIDKHLSS